VPPGGILQQDDVDETVDVAGLDLLRTEGAAICAATAAARIVTDRSVRTHASVRRD